MRLSLPWEWTGRTPVRQLLVLGVEGFEPSRDDACETPVLCPADWDSGIVVELDGLCDVLGGSGEPAGDWEAIWGNMVTSGWRTA